MVQQAETTFWGKVKEGVISYVVNNLLSGPITHATYFLGTQAVGLYRALAVTPAAALTGDIASALGKEIPAAERVSWGEVGAQLHGLYHGMIDGFVAGRSALATGVTVMKGDPSGADLFTNEILYRPQAIPGRLGYVMETPSRMVAAIHTINYATHYEAYLAQQAWRDAAGAGLDPTSEAFAARMASIRNAPPAPLMEAGHNYALEMTMMKRPQFGGTQYAIQKALHSTWAGRLAFPFVQLGMNMERLAGEQTFLGFLGRTARDDIAGKNGEAAQQMRAGQVAIGTGLALGTIGYAMSGNLSGGGPTDAKQRQVLEMTGWKPYSVKVGNLWIPYRKYLAFLGPLVAGAADLYEVGHAMKQEGLSAAAKSLLFGFSEVVGDETWMRQFANFAKLGRGDVSLEKFVRDTSMEFLPFSVGLGQVASMADPVWRDVRSEMDALRNHIPGLHSQLHPVRDVWGQPMRGGSMVFPAQATNDAATNALIAAEYWPARMSRKSKHVDLSDQQYDDLTRIAGQDAKLRVDALVANPSWKVVPPAVQKEMLKKIIDGSRTRAETIIQMQNPDLIKAQTQLKLQQLGRQTVH
jgi:hypothetical protein